MRFARQVTIRRRIVHISIDLGQQLTAEFDAIGETDWNKELQSFSDATFYHTWAYAAVRCGEKRVSRMVLRQDGRIVALAQIRLHLTPILPCGFAYVHWGPLWRRIGEPANIAVLRGALTALKTEFTHRRKLILRLLPAVYGCWPDRARINQAILDVGFVQSSNGKRMLFFDIRPSLEELRKALVPTWRNRLSGAEKSGLRIVEGNSVDLLASYAQIHNEMTSRKGLTNDLGLAHLINAFPRLPLSLRPSIVLAYLGDRAVAGNVVSTVGKTAIFLFGAITGDGMPVKAANLVHWTCVALLKGRGFDSYDLSGINPVKNAGIYHFKVGLCGKNGTETDMDEFTCSESAFNETVVRAGLLVRSALRM
jgi:hypothetical protein